MQTFDTSRLDRQSIEYLSQIRENRGRSFDGIFVPLIEKKIPRTQQLGIRCCLTLLLLVAALAFYWLVSWGQLPERSGTLLAITVGASVFLLLSVFDDLRKPASPTFLKPFLWADDRYIWVATERVVRVAKLSELSDAWIATKDRLPSETTTVRLEYDTGELHIETHEFADAERLVHFLNAIRCVTGADRAYVGLPNLRPGEAAALAKEVMENGAEGVLRVLKRSHLASRFRIPQPKKDPLAKNCNYNLAWTLNLCQRAFGSVRQRKLKPTRHKI